jgi:SNF2 family DNA or RNA helicase
MTGLIICPLSIMKSAWQNDLFRFAVHRSCDIAYGKREVRKAIIEGDAEFVIINFDGLGIVRDAIKENGEFDLIVADEASAYKNMQTDRWKALRDVMTPQTWLWMLTGTPAAQSPVDAYGLAKLINPDGIPKFFGQFRDKVMEKVGQFRWIPRINAETTVHNALQPAIRFEKAQCLDLPAVTHIEREVPLTSQQIKYYNILKQMMIMQAGGEEVTSVNAAVKLNKLLQISGGAVYSDSKEVVEFDVSNRLNVVQEVIEESSHKVLVFVPFTHTISLLQKHLEKAGIKTDVISGPVPVIWYAPVTSVETYLQANARIDRPGQKNVMTIVHISGSEVERRLYKMLRGNIANHNRIIELYKQEISTK